METKILREPVDNSHGENWGYVLRFRDGLHQYIESRTTEGEHDLPIPTILELIEHRYGLILLDEELLIDKYSSLDCKNQIVMVLRLQSDNEELILSKCDELRSQGFLVGVMCEDIHVVGSLLDKADYCVVDMSSSNLRLQKHVVKQVNHRGITTIAINVNTKSLYDKAMAWKCHFFHGEAMHRHRTEEDEEMQASKAIYMQLMKEVFRSELEYNIITLILEKDVALTYKLLSFINSPWYGVKHKIKSIKQALVMLGPNEIRRWIAIAVVKDLASEESLELMIRSLARGRAAERLSTLVDGMVIHDCELFLMGLLSLIDKLTHTPLEEALKQLSISDDICEALLERKGIFSPIYEILLAADTFEDGEFVERCIDLGFEEPPVVAILNSADTWARRVLA